MNPMHSSRQSIGACKRNEFWRFSLMDRASSAPICPFLNTLVRPRTDGAGGALLEHHLVAFLQPFENLGHRAVRESHRHRDLACAFFLTPIRKQHNGILL